MCSEVAAVADAIALDLEASMPRVSVPPSGVMLWRAQRRARQEAARIAVRAGTTIQALSVAAGRIALLVAMPVFEWRGLLARSRDMIADAATVAQFSLPLAAVLAISLAVARSRSTLRFGKSDAPAARELGQSMKPCESR